MAVVVTASLCAALLAASLAAAHRGVVACIAAVITASMLLLWPPGLGSIAFDRSDVALSRAGTWLALTGSLSLFAFGNRAARWVSAGALAMGVAALVAVLVRDRLRARWLKHVFDGAVTGWSVTASASDPDARPLFTADDARAFDATLMRRRDETEGAYRDDARDERIARVPASMAATTQALASRTWRVGVTLTLSALIATAGAGLTSARRRTADPPADEYPETRITAGPAPRVRAPGPTPGGRIAQLALAGHDGCARSVDGSVWCWGGLEAPRTPGDDAAWQRDMRGITGATHLAIHGASACVVLASGRARCWVPEWWGRDGDPAASLTEIADISIGRMYACALRRDATVQCWGRSDAAPLRGANPASAAFQEPFPIHRLVDVVQVSAGAEHVCVVTRDGAVRCWGANYDHELGVDGAATSEPGAPIAGLGPVARVVAGDRFTCALLRDGAVRCWGDYDHDSATPSVRVPTEIAGLRGVVDLAGGGAHVCAVMGDGAVACIAGRGLVSGVVRRDRGVRLALGGEHACARSGDGVVRCWSWEGGAPSRVTALRGAREVAVLERTSFDGDACGLFEDGSVRCEALDVRPAEPREVPAPRRVAGVSRASRIALGGGLGCAALLDGGLVCWRHGEASQGARSIVTPAGGVTDVAVGAWGLCALGRDGAVACAHDRAPLRVISNARRFVQLAAGEGHTCARADDGSVWCWGDNDAGQLGDGTDRDRDAPAQVPGLTEAVEIAAGSQHTCARRRDGSVLCWGRGAEGQLGDGASTERHQPVAMTDVRDATSVAASGERTCVLGGVVVRCWGSHPVGAASPSSTRVGRNVDTTVDLAIGRAHACALGRNSDVSCWGDNSFGQLGSTVPPILDSMPCRPSPCTQEVWRPITYTDAPLPVAW